MKRSIFYYSWYHSLLYYIQICSFLQCLGPRGILLSLLFHMQYWSWNAIKLPLAFAGSIPFSSCSLPQFRISEIFRSLSYWHLFPLIFQWFLIAAQRIFLKVKTISPLLKIHPAASSCPRINYTLKLTYTILPHWTPTSLFDFIPFYLSFYSMPRPHYYLQYSFTRIVEGRKEAHF